MVLKIINATEAKSGTNIILDGTPYTVRNVDISKTGKHGSSKCRIEAIGIMSGQKKIIVVPGHERFEVPLVEKKKAQVLSITPAGDMANVMDLETFETMDLPIMEEARTTFGPEDQVEYMVIDEKLKVIKRKITN